MKTTLKKAGILFSCISALTSFSQSSSYVPFPDSNAVWHQEFDYYNGQTFQQEYYNLYVKEDVTIGAYTYKKVYKDYNNWYYNVYAGAYRNDASAKKVYYMSPGAASECLLYDFSLNAGDTIYTDQLCDSLGNWMMDSTQYYVVSSIDSVLLTSGYRKQINLTGYIDSAGCCTYVIDQHWLEGIGDMSGMVPQFNGFEAFHKRNCFSQNSVLEFGNPAPCSYVLGAAREEKLPFNFFSSSKQLFFTGQSFTGCTIIVYDISGRTVHRSVLSENVFDHSSLSDGIYIFNLMKDNKIYPGKFMTH